MKVWLWGGEVRRVPRPPSRRVSFGGGLGGCVVIFWEWTGG